MSEDKENETTEKNARSRNSAGTHCYIKASEIKPGMVIGIDRGDNFNDISLVTATNGIVKVEYTHLSLQQVYGGKLIGTMDGETKVQVIKGEDRKHIISEIKKDVFRNLHDIEADINTIWLIQSMDEGI